MKQSVDFINILISDLRKLGIENIKHDRGHNFIVVGDIEVRGICIYENCICCGMKNVKYFIDGIDMRNCENLNYKQLNNLRHRIREIMSHFREDTKQLFGKEELIKILTENNAEVAE